MKKNLPTQPVPEPQPYRIILDRLPKRPEHIQQLLHEAWYRATLDGRHGEAIAFAIEYVRNKKHLRSDMDQRRWRKAGGMLKHETEMPDFGY